MSDDLPFPPLPKPPLVSEAVAEAAEINVKAYADLVRAEARAAVLAELRAKVEALLIEPDGAVRRCVACGRQPSLGHDTDCPVDDILALLDDPS